MTLEQLNHALLHKDSNIDTDRVLVFNTYKNIHKSSLLKMMYKVHNIVNKKMFKYFRNHPEKQITFYTFPQSAHNNTHAHVLIKIPKEYDRNEVFKLLHKTWLKLDNRQKTRHELYNEDARSIFGNVFYASRQCVNSERSLAAHIKSIQSFEVI